MNTSLFVRIRKRTQAGYIILFIVLMPFFFGLLNSLLQLPNATRYSIDFAWFFLLFLLIYFQHSIRYQYERPLLLWLAAFVVTSACLYVLKFQSPIYYLWGVRNNFRFYPFFLAACVFQTEQDAEDYLKLFDILFWTNAVVSFVQYFVFDLRQDYLGGLFGAEQGCNAYTNIFFVIIVAKSLIYFLNRKESIYSCVAKCVTALAIAAMAELKFFMIEFVLIIAMAVLLTHFSWRNLMIIVGGLAAVSVGTSLMILIFPNIAKDMSLFGLLKMASSAQGYTNSGDLNRLTSISTINKWLLRDLPNQLIGKGLGNCENSTFAIANTYFYKRYYWTHYTWMSTAFMYLEMGYIGLTFLYGFFVLNYFVLQKRQKMADANVPHCQLAKIVSVCAIGLLIYNSSLRLESGFMVYLVLAFPYMRKQYKDSIKSR